VFFFKVGTILSRFVSEFRNVWTSVEKILKKIMSINRLKYFENFKFSCIDSNKIKTFCENFKYLLTVISF